MSLTVGTRSLQLPTEMAGRDTVGFSGVEGRKEGSCLNKYDPKLGIWLCSSLMLNAARMARSAPFPHSFQIGFVSVMIPLKNTIEIFFKAKKRLFNDMEVLMELFPFSVLLKKELKQTF